MPVVGLACNFWKWGQVTEPDPVGEDGARGSRVLHTELKVSMWPRMKGHSNSKGDKKKWARMRWQRSRGKQKKIASPT